MKSKSKKMNSYVKLAVFMLVAMFVGGIFGGLTGFFSENGQMGSVYEMLEQFIELIRQNMILLLSVLLVMNLLIGESVFFKLKKLGSEIAESEEETADHLEYEFEKISTAGTLINSISFGLSMLIFATGYTSNRIISVARKDVNNVLLEIAVFLLLTIYISYWQVRFVKINQRIYPEKKGDPLSLKFQNQWMESCDEAEKAVIYESSFYTYTLASKYLPGLILIAMLSHLVWNTGILAIFLTSLAWLFVTISFQFCSLKKKKEQLK